MKNVVNNDAWNFGLLIRYVDIGNLVSNEHLNTENLFVRRVEWMWIVLLDRPLRLLVC